MDYLVIPAYEPDFNLIRLLKKIKEKSQMELIVVNDGSSSKAKVLFEQAEQYATVLHHANNQGKGQALKTAFTYIQSLGQYGTVVTADADGQHKVWDIFRVATKASENPNQLILGARALTGKVPLRSRFGNSLTRALFKLQTGMGVSDTQTSFSSLSSRESTKLLILFTIIYVSS